MRERVGATSFYRQSYQLNLCITTTTNSSNTSFKITPRGHPAKAGPLPFIYRYSLIPVGRLTAYCGQFGPAAPCPSGPPALRAPRAQDQHRPVIAPAATGPTLMPGQLRPQIRMHGFAASTSTSFGAPGRERPGALSIMRAHAFKAC